MSLSSISRSSRNYAAAAGGESNDANPAAEQLRIFPSAIAALEKDAVPVGETEEKIALRREDGDEDSASSLWEKFGGKARVAETFFKDSQGKEKTASRVPNAPTLAKLKEGRSGFELKHSGKPLAEKYLSEMMLFKAATSEDIYALSPRFKKTLDGKDALVRIYMKKSRYGGDIMTYPEECHFDLEETA